MTNHDNPPSAANAESATSRAELAELRQAVRDLTGQVAELADEVRLLRGAARPDEPASVDEDTLRVIAAAVSAYLGNRARIKQVHFHTGRAWARAGRSEVQRRQVQRG